MAEIDDTRAMDVITELMSGVEWNADTLDEIANIVTMTGRHIDDPFDPVSETIDRLVQEAQERRNK